MSARPNRLAAEKSPYLLQHAHNPVDWYPWGDDAFDRAVRDNKPVFLSVGYATCHWCHVMAHESFEDPEVADLLNRDFIAIKVDREERPDIDSVYMTACQQMTGQGGWPLTIIMTPDARPFFAGTYLPKRSRAGMTGLVDLLRHVHTLWTTQPDLLRADASRLTTLLNDTSTTQEKGNAAPGLLDAGYDELARSFDPVNGGFGRAPKFPTPAILLFLLRYWKRTGSAHALLMVTRTLDALRCGGIHDHIGGGFHRYATDAQWRIPHFEKMLSDQGLLLAAFTDAWLVTKDPAYRTTAEGIIAFVHQDLRSPYGAFFTALDADSSSGEGAYYLWTPDEFDRVLGREDAAFAARVFSIPGPGKNDDGRAGAGILVLDERSIPDPAGSARVRAIIRKLQDTRSRRPLPLQDTKILSDGNGLMIAALARASRAFGNPLFADMARDALEYILKVHRMPDGGLYHRSCEGEAAIPGFADDYACIIRALIEYYETTFEPVWLDHALRLNRYLAENFSDSVDGGYFTVSARRDQLIVRKKEIYDGATPSANSLQLENLSRLSHLTGDSRLSEQASSVADAFTGTILRNPSAYTAYLSGLDHHLGPGQDIILTGERADPTILMMLKQIHARYLPNLTLHLCTPDSAKSALVSLAPFLSAFRAKKSRPGAYVCSGHTCSSPIPDVDGLIRYLDEKKR